MGSSNRVPSKQIVLDRSLMHSDAGVRGSLPLLVFCFLRSDRFFSVVSSLYLPFIMSSMRPGKRAGDELRKDEDSGDDGSGGFATEPQLATPEEMAKRRIVRVRRPTSVPSGPTGLFKSLQGSTLPAGGAANPNPSGGGFFSSLASSTGSSLPALSVAPMAAPQFPTGAFNFSHSVASFIEARQQADLRQTTADPQATNGAEDGGESVNPSPSDVLQGSSVVQPASGDVLVDVPSKLYGFDKATNQWVERGVGNAKIKKEDTTAAGGSGGGVYRLLVRDGYALNVTIAKHQLVLSSTASHHVIFTIGTESGAAHHLLKFVGAQAEDNAKRFTEVLKTVLQKVETE